MPTTGWRPPPVKKPTLVGQTMDDTLAGDKIEDLRQLVDSNLAKIIEEQSVLFGDVA